MEDMFYPGWSQRFYYVLRAESIIVNPSSAYSPFPENLNSILPIFLGGGIVEQT